MSTLFRTGQREKKSYVLLVTYCTSLVQKVGLNG